MEGSSAFPSWGRYSRCDANLRDRGGRFGVLRPSGDPLQRGNHSDRPVPSSGTRCSRHVPTDAHVRRAFSERSA